MRSTGPPGSAEMISPKECVDLLSDDLHGGDRPRRGSLASSRAVGCGYGHCLSAEASRRRRSSSRLDVGNGPRSRPSSRSCAHIAFTCERGRPRDRAGQRAERRPRVLQVAESQRGFIKTVGTLMPRGIGCYRLEFTGHAGPPQRVVWRKVGYRSSSGLTPAAVSLLRSLRVTATRAVTRASQSPRPLTMTACRRADRLVQGKRCSAPASSSSRRWPR